MLLLVNVTKVFPAVGQEGTSVTISGEGLLSGGTSLESVSIAGVDVDSIDSFEEDESEVVVTLGASADAITGDIV